MIPFLLLKHSGGGSKSGLPLASYLFLVIGLFPLGAAVYCVREYWETPAWNHETLTGNIMYHDPACFLGAAMMLCIAAMCVLKFVMWHGPFKRR